MADFNHYRTSGGLTDLNKIDVEDLQYIERDLNFAQKASVAFLLYGDNQANASYALQKLIVIAAAQRQSATFDSDELRSLHQQTDLLRQYANNNSNNWRHFIIEALCIVNARRVLRKIGFCWEELRQHYLPHIKSVSLHIHPLLKTLYYVCEDMTKAQAGRLEIYINEKYINRPEDQLRFYDAACLEVFLLDWLTRNIIKLGNKQTQHSDVHVLIEFFKFNDLDRLAILLVDTINSNSNANNFSDSGTKPEVTPADRDLSSKTATESVVVPAATDCNGSINDCSTSNNIVAASRPIVRDKYCYTVRHKHAGIALIINQETFHQTVKPELRHKLPKIKLASRLGTKVDKCRLKATFSNHGYKIVECDDLDNLEILQNIREVVKRSEVCDSLIVCILSHGIDGAVYGSNSIPVKIADIEHIMNGAEFLKNKPKMLVIQACQKIESEKSDVKHALLSIQPDASVACAMVAAVQEHKLVLNRKAYDAVLCAMLSSPPNVELPNNTWFVQVKCNTFDFNIVDIKHSTTWADNLQQKPEILLVQSYRKNTATMDNRDRNAYNDIQEAMSSVTGFEQSWQEQEASPSANLTCIQLHCDTIDVDLSNVDHVIAAENLTQKPKMLVMYACKSRRGEYDATNVCNARVSIKASASPEALLAAQKPNSNVVLAPEAYADFLKAMSTVAGHESMRHTKTGTWFIQALCDAIDEYGKSKHMLDILTTVTDRVTSKRGQQNEVMVPSTHTTLRKYFYLP